MGVEGEGKRMVEDVGVEKVGVVGGLEGKDVRGGGVDDE